MKKKVVLLMVALALAATSLAAVETTFNFEGTDLVGVSGGTIVEGIGATTPTHSYMVEKGGWGVDFTFNDSAAIKEAMATVGTVIVDVTTAGFPAGQEWGDVGLFMQGGGSTISGYWGIGNWAGNLVVGTTQTITFQLTAEQRTQVAASDWWWQLGIGSNAPAAIPAVIDPITQEIITPAITPTFYFDNVRIVPEPASLLILGLGALAMLKGRKV